MAAGAMVKVPSTEASTEDRIRVRAYELYLLREGAAGSELDDWLQAEREILAKGGKAA
jgi:hypothetical protein